MLVGSKGPTERQTMSVIELYWTAKKDQIAVKFKHFVQNLNFVIQVKAATKVPSAITKT